MKITITREDYKKFFLYNYYYGSKKLIRFMRMYMGPILFFVGLYLYLTYENIEPVFIFFCIGYGVYYFLKPLILLILSKNQDEVLEFEFIDKTINIKDRLNEATINLEKNNLNENKLAYFLKLDNGQIIFFPKNKLNEKSANEFKKRI